MTPVRRARVAVTLCVALVGCVTPPQPQQAAAPQPATPSYSKTENEYRSRALALSNERRWAEALAQWELLLLMRPGSSEYREQVDRTRKQIAEGVAEALGAADQARRRGDLDRASTEYLRVLSLDAGNTAAAQGLREIERERTRRAYLNRPPRTTMGTAPAQSNPNGSYGALSDLDVGTMLLRQGDLTGSIQAFQRELKRTPTDSQARAGLAEAYFQLGAQYVQQGRTEDALVYFDRARASGYADREALNAAVEKARKSLGEEYYRLGVQAAATDTKKAIFLWERSLYFDPTQKEASARLAELRRAGASAQSTGPAKSAR
jgi:tetratricopeptide (TPR) repeat protein